LLAIEGAHLRRWRLTERLDVTGQHLAPARFVLLNGLDQLSDRTAASHACALERDPGPGTLRFEQLIEEDDQLRHGGRFLAKP
jgi:hypothetical protein